MRDYVECLAASERSGDERRVVWVGDSGQLGTDVYWCETVGQWLAVDLAGLGVRRVDDIALVQLDADADPSALEDVKLACDCEREDGLWIVESSALEALARKYDSGLRVIWESGSPMEGRWDRAEALGPHLQPRVATGKGLD